MRRGSRCATTALGFTFARGGRGYRSVATAATPEAKFGTRQISAPVDRGVAADARARDAQRQGGYAALDGEAFALRDGIGEDGSSTTQAIAFAADGTGFTGGTVAFGAVSRAAPGPPPAAEPLPVQGDALVAGAISPTGDGRVFALAPLVGRDALRAGQRLVPSVHRAAGDGSTTLAAARHRLAAEEPADRRREPPACWRRPPPTRSASAPASRTGSCPERGSTTSDELEVQNTVLAIACTPSDPLDCVAVGLDGLIVRGDGTNWRVQALPEIGAGARPHITGVAFDGRTPLLATTDGLYVGRRPATPTCATTTSAPG